MATIGFQLLINSVVLVNSLFHSKDAPNTKQESQEEFYGTITLDEPRTATNSARIEMSGTVQQFDTVDIFLNDEIVKTAQLVNGRFSEIIGTLRSGSNTLYTLAKTQGGVHSKKSEIYSISYLDDPLEITVTTPTDDMKTSTQDISIKGSVSVVGSLKVNNQPIIVSSDGSFDTTYHLKDGENILVFYGEDVAGNVQEVVVEVIYQKED